MKHLNFSCGCKFEVLQEEPLRLNASLDIENIPLDCQKTWDFIGSQNLCGVFQLDSNFSQNIAHKFKPRNLKELAIVVAISRPGASEGTYKGKTVLNRVLDRRNLKEDVEPIDISISDILEPTYQMLCFQEQTTKILQKLAGFSLNECEIMRKAIGKKKPELMPKLRKDFINGCNKVGLVDEKKANELFDLFEASERYLFNKCLLPNTLIVTKDGEIKTIEELQIGEKILAPEINGENYTEVLDKFDNGEQDVFEVTLESGKQICCTIQHKFLCENGEILPLWQILTKELRIICEDE
jgi:hypothetical protein